MKTKLLLIASLLISASSYAESINSPDVLDEHLWISGTLGRVNMNHNSELQDNGLSTQVKIGYDFNRYVALYMGGGLHENVANDTMKYVQAGLQVSYPITTQWSGFGTIATVGTSDFNDAKTNHAWRGKFGLGISYRITPQFSTQLGMDFYNDMPVTSNLNSNRNEVYVGLKYHFNQPDTFHKVIQQINLN